MRDVAIIGVGQVRFGRYPDVSFVDHGVKSAIAALDDAGVPWASVQETWCGACSVGAFAGNRVGHGLGLTGAPIHSIDNASASGTAAFRQAYLAVAEGRVDLSMALGVGKMERAMLDAAGSDPQEIRRNAAMAFPSAATVFGLLAQRRMHEHGTDPSVFARIAVKNHKHGSLNPFSQYQKERTLEEVQASRMISDPLHLLESCPTGDGGAAVILSSMEHAQRLSHHPVVKVAASVCQGEMYVPYAFPGVDITYRMAPKAYEAAGIGPDDVDLVQLHDAFSNEELEYYEALGLCPPGDGEKLVLQGDVEIGGRIPVNTDGGLISRGHPLGPTGIAQIAETVLQLRGQAGPRQVENAKVGLVQMIGGGSVGFIHVLIR